MIRLLLLCAFLVGCENIESIEPNVSMSQDQYGGYSGTVGGKIVFRDRRKLVNYSKDK